MAHGSLTAFAREAARILELGIAHRVNKLGGYGPAGEVIYERHPRGCPSTLVTARGPAKATFMSNGAVAFEVQLDEGLDVHVLSGSFDATEKRETGVPSNNLWLQVLGRTRPAVAALVNPRTGAGCDPAQIKIVKLGDPDRAMWYGATFAPGGSVSFRTAVRFRLAGHASGVALLRETFVHNLGRAPLKAHLWSFFNLHGTQRFVYNKELWYDSGLPVTPREIVAAATVPYSDIVQLKRVSSVCGTGLRAVDATCDYTSFVGDSGDFCFVPRAVREGRFGAGAGKKLNRFSVPTIAANLFALDLAPGRATALLQSVLYVTDRRSVARFRSAMNCPHPDYPRVARCFVQAAKQLLRVTPDAARLAISQSAESSPPAFEVVLPRQPVLSEYARSLWTGVAELYENCRAHGAKMAQGIELGTRDRGQDMWPKMKEDPARVRADLVHALSFMYVTVDRGHRWSRPLTRSEKLHGLFPRQYPSRWDDRRAEVANDNRPYADSPLWLVDSLAMYIRETGDVSILGEHVGTVRLTQPDCPERSGIVGCDRAHTVAEAVAEVFDSYRRHVEDSPYGLAQVLYGDWCDPVDMFGTSAVGDASTRGIGRGAGLRLSAHLFDSLISAVDLFSSRKVQAAARALELSTAPAEWKKLANCIRQNALRIAWEDGRYPGFVGMIHELRKDGSRPAYGRGETGYTLGSMEGCDFDGAPRRDLTALAYGLRMLQTRRAYLDPVRDAEAKIAGLLTTCDRYMFHPKLGLRLLHPPIANNELSRRLVGRMGIIPAGCAENGEYHHAQMMLHRFRVLLPGQADQAWRQFRCIVSAARDESLAGPFEMPCTSYASDAGDPHFGKGMYFGLSGSTGWIVEFLQSIAGLELALHDDDLPAVRIVPRLPAELGETLVLKRLIHVAQPGGGYRRVPVTLRITKEGAGPSLRAAVRINGKARSMGVSPMCGKDRAGRPDYGEAAQAAEVRRLDGVRSLEIVITYLGLQGQQETAACART